MLTIENPDRRSFLTLGALGLGGLSLPALLAGRAQAAGEALSLATGKSVIFLFQQGGPSQFETFDPKPDAPDGIRTVGDTIQTSLPGVRFGQHMKRLAGLANKFTVVRNFQTNNSGHNIQPIVSPDTLNANIGALYSRVVGGTRPTTGMPTNIVVFPEAACKDALKGNARGDITATGQLGADNAPFIPGAGGQLQQNMRLTLSAERLTDRQDLMADLDRLNRRVAIADDQKLIADLQKQAYQVLLSGGVADALDLTKESSATIARYETKQYAKADGWNKVNRGKKGMYTGHAKALGKQLLLARRLCEAGCGFVTIHDGYDGVWDMHADSNNLNIKDGMEACGPAFDHAVAAFIEDCEERGIADKILLVCCGEMGRTPRLNKNGGRDHWAKLSPLLLYGGGIVAGQAVGQSTRDGGEPAANPQGPKNLIATLLNVLFDVGRLRVAPSLTQIAKLAEPGPIAGVL
jgi:hypothetical protein